MTSPRPEPAPPGRTPAGARSAPVGLADRPARRPHPAARPVPAGSTAHPAKMLPAIAATAITRYTQPGDLVADPMCGIGTTLVEAVHLGRDGLGIEYEDRWAAIAAANVAHARRQGATGTAEVIRGDARQLPALLPPGTAGRAALVVTSPPYGPSVHGQVTPSSAAARERRGPQVRQPLRPGPGQPRQPGPGRAARRVHPDPGRLPGAAAPRRPGRGHRPALAAARRTGRPARRRHRRRRPAGLVPAARCVALLAGLRGGQLIARPSFFQLDNLRRARRRGEPWHLIVHEDVLIFRSPAEFPAVHRRAQVPQPAIPGPGTAGTQAAPRPAPGNRA